MDTESSKFQSAKTFYYIATCILLMLMAEKPYSTPAKGLHLYLRKLKYICKLLFVQILCKVFKYIDKYYKFK